MKKAPWHYSWHIWGTPCITFLQASITTSSVKNSERHILLTTSSWFFGGNFYLQQTVGGRKAVLSGRMWPSTVLTTPKNSHCLKQKGDDASSFSSKAKVQGLSAHASRTSDLAKWLLGRISGKKKKKYRATYFFDLKRWSLAVFYRFKRVSFLLRHFAHLFRK